MWITIRQFADQNGISVPAVESRIKTGSLKCRKENGRRVVEVPDETQDANQDAHQKIESSSEKSYTKSALESRWDVENELKRQKILNIEADIIIKKQKVKEYRERLRVEFCEGTLECFTDAFADLKAVLVDCKLKKEQIKKFKDCYAKCLKKFEQKLVAFLKKKDDEEEEESKEDK